MIKLLLFTAFLNTSEIQTLPPDSIKIEANRKRGKGNRGKRRGGGGLR